MPFEIHRLKGRLRFDDGTVKMVQGVREIFEIFDCKSTMANRTANSNGEEAQETRQGDNVEGKLVLIGRGLQELPWANSLLQTINCWVSDY